eukprot:5121847-Amphidinium_carterae.1
MQLLSTLIDLSNAVAHGDLTSWEWVSIDVMMFLIVWFALRYSDLRGTLYLDFFFVLVFGGGIFAWTVVRGSNHQAEAEGLDHDLFEHYTT